MGRCDFCGRDAEAPLSCPACGGRFCPDHALPPDHSCAEKEQLWFEEPPIVAEQAPPPQSPPKPPASLPSSTGHRKTAMRAAVLLLGILILLVVGYAALAWIGSAPVSPGTAPELNATPPLPAAPPAAFSPVPSTPAPAAPPLLVKLPATVRITPTPTPLAGVVSYPNIASDASRATFTRNYTFPFQDRMVTVTAGVNRSVYYGAKNGEKTIVTSRREIERSDWAPGYFLAFVNDYHQEMFYADLRSSFRQVRQEMGLSDDEYLDLMAVFVQTLEYDTEGARDLEGGNRFPAETFVDGKGVCGDKSMLLAGLLAREGYDVALLLFDSEKHMAVGVRSSRDGYRNTSYAFLETTRLSYVGVVPDNLAGGIVLRTAPQVIPVGNGWKGYAGTPQTFYIKNQSGILRDRIIALESQLKAFGSDVRDVKGYNALVDEHNRYVMYYNYVLRHEYDRPGTFAYLLANETALDGVMVVQPEPVPAPAYATCSLPAETGCPAGSRCCTADATCYAWCTEGVWSPDDCVCRL